MVDTHTHSSSDILIRVAKVVGSHAKVCFKFLRRRKDSAEADVVLRSVLFYDVSDVILQGKRGRRKARQKEVER